MKKNTEEFWNERYAREEYAYGLAPNAFFKRQLQELPAGRLLLPAEGEGRNAVYAARMGWKVDAFDLSREGQKKAVQLARKNKVTINYQLADFEAFEARENSYDCIALIYAHVPAEKRHAFHRKMLPYLKAGGVLILEGFSKEQYGRSSGGPKDKAMLFSKEELQNDFKDLTALEIQEMETELSEGPFHQGKASVIRLRGVK